MHYSPSTRGFYDDRHTAIPADAIEITPARHAALMRAQSQGAEIVPGTTGRPVERWPSALSPGADPGGALTVWRAGAFLTDVQLLIGLVAECWISEAEGASWRDGTLPPQVVSLIDMLPEDQRFGASVRALRGRRIERLDPLVEALAVAQDKSASDLDAFFQTYSQI